MLLCEKASIEKFISSSLLNTTERRFHKLRTGVFQLLKKDKHSKFKDYTCFLANKIKCYSIVGLLQALAKPGQTNNPLVQIVTSG